MIFLSNFLFMKLKTRSGTEQEASPSPKGDNKIKEMGVGGGVWGAGLG